MSKFQLVQKGSNEDDLSISFGGEIKVGETDLTYANQIRCSGFVEKETLTLENINGDIIPLPELSSGEIIPIMGIKIVALVEDKTLPKDVRLYWYASGRII